MDEAKPEATVFRYKRPDDLSTPKTHIRLVRDERMTVNVQVVKEGGENNLHSHTNMDGLWFVLAGKARFYTTNDELLGEFGQGEGVFIPRNFPYWFESAAEEPLKILQAEATDTRRGDPRVGRVDHEPIKASYGSGRSIGSE